MSRERIRIIFRIRIFVRICPLDSPSITRGTGSGSETPPDPFGSGWVLPGSDLQEDQDPTSERKPDSDPTIEKNPDPDPI